MAKEAPGQSQRGKELIDAGVGQHQGDRAPGRRALWGGSEALPVPTSVAFFLSFLHYLGAIPETPDPIFSAQFGTRGTW